MMHDFSVDAVSGLADSLKWGKYRGRDVLAMWVADMDFATAPAVIEALTRRVRQGVLGYALPPAELTETILDYLAGRFGWQVRPEWLVWMPGLVSALNVVSRALAGRPGDEVLSFVPVYPPFLTAPDNGGAVLTCVPLARAAGRYVFDLDALRAAITPHSRVLLLCSPHNPVGRCWSAAELRPLAELCLEHGIALCSDEIHCDLVLDPVAHVPTATLSDEIAQATITLMAPSKTYNIPGLNCSFAIIPNDTLRRRFNDARRDIVPHNNVLGYTAALAAYRDSGGWVADMLTLLRANRDRVEQAVAALPGVSMDHVEATYLAWLDVRPLGLAEPALFFERHGLGLSDGAHFKGSGFVRLNFATSPERLEMGLERLRVAVEQAGQSRP